MVLGYLEYTMSVSTMFLKTMPPLILPSYHHRIVVSIATASPDISRQSSLASMTSPHWAVWTAPLHDGMFMQEKGTMTGHNQACQDQPILVWCRGVSVHYLVPWSLVAPFVAYDARTPRLPRELLLRSVGQEQRTRTQQA